MNPVTRIEGIAAPLLRDNIDTDTLIPSRDITSPSREGFGAKLFAPWRFDGPGGPENPTFILNREPWRHAGFPCRVRAVARWMGARCPDRDRGRGRERLMKSDRS